MTRVPVTRKHESKSQELMKVEVSVVCSKDGGRPNMERNAGSP